MTNKSLFNFYLDENDKRAAIEKLNRVNGECNKGQLASLLRVMIKMFIATPDEKLNSTMMEAVMAEYEYTAKLNKRSKL